MQVTNQNWSTVVVYLVRSGARIRLGMVTSMKTEVLRVRPSLLPSASSIHLLVDPVGSREIYISPGIQVTPGQRIEFNIENHLPTSSITVWDQ